MCVCECVCECVCVFVCSCVCFCTSMCVGRGRDLLSQNYVMTKIIVYFSSAIECAGFCLSDSKCRAFFWNQLTLSCQTSLATDLAGDLTNQAVDGYIDNTLEPGFSQ